MDRPRFPRVLLATVLTGAVAAGAACGGSPEQQVIDGYFRAARLNDQTTLANIATVRFDRDEQGTVQAFTVTTIGDEQRRTLELRTLKKAYDEAREADDQFTKRKKEYQDGNLEAIDRVLRAERTNARLRGRDAEVQAAWTKWRDDTADYSKKLADARQALADERGIAEISVFDARSPVDVAEFDGELITKEVTISAQVRGADGQVSTRNLVVTMQRAELRNGREISGRWIITGLRDAAPTS